MPHDDLNKILRISERLDNQFRPIFEINKQTAAIRAMSQPAIETINIFNELKNSQPLTYTNIYDSPGVKSLVSTVSDLLSTYAIPNINDSFYNAVRPMLVTISNSLQNIDTSAMTKSILSFSAAISSLPTSIDIENDIY